MIKQEFRTPEQNELEEGMAIWLEGRNFGDTDPVLMRVDMQKPRSVCGPFLIERILFKKKHSSHPDILGDSRVDLVDPETGSRRSMMSSWLLVPKEDK